VNLLQQIGNGLGRVISPLRQPPVCAIPVPHLEAPDVHVVPVPHLRPATVLRITRSDFEKPVATANLLLNFSAISQASIFRPLDAPIFRVPRTVLDANGLITFDNLLLVQPGIGEDITAILFGLLRPTWISENLFVPLGKREVKGRDYRERRAKDAGQQQSLFAEPAEAAKPTDFKKAYTREKAKYGAADYTTQTLTIWDLIYPLLQPPLNLEFSPQFDVLEKLRPYQKKGISFLVDRESALLADEMGTGKTVMALVALRLLFRLGKVKKALIVCPVSVLSVWQEHLLKWASELEFTVVRGSKETRKMDWRYPAHVYVAAYDTVAADFLTVVKKHASVRCPGCRRDLHFGQKIHIEDEDRGPHLECPHCHAAVTELPVSSALVESETMNAFDAVIADEAQYIKNPATDRSRAIRLINAKFKWAITGTPLETKLDDLAAIFSFIKPNYLRAEGLTSRLAREYMAPYFLRRLKKDVLSDLPAKIKQNTWLELDDHQTSEYQSALGQGQRELAEKGEQVSKIHINGVFI